MTDRLCIICQEIIYPCSEIETLKCSHIYHSNCINTWFKTSYTCPICRDPIDTGREILFNYDTPSITYTPNRRNRDNKRVKHILFLITIVFVIVPSIICLGFLLEIQYNTTTV